MVKTLQFIKGYVEFHELDGLENALKMDGESLMGRKLRINVAEGGKSKDGRPRREESKAAMDSNWRAGQRAAPPPVPTR